MKGVNLSLVENTIGSKGSKKSSKKDSKKSSSKKKGQKVCTVWCWIQSFFSESEYCIGQEGQKEEQQKEQQERQEG